MGTPSWKPSDWADRSASYAGKSDREIFTKSSIDASLDPKTITVRECVDSEPHPLTTPIILAVDDTGSMGHLATEIIRNGLGVIINNILDRKPITDPQIMCMAIGDTEYDSAPVQATQFEADASITDQIEKFFIEGGGGANAGESYIAAWYMAAFKTKCDSQIKRGKKGYLFTIGDEPPLMTLERSHIKEFFGDDVQSDFTAQQLLAIVSENWEVFHLIIKPGSRPTPLWGNLLGQRAVPVKDHTKLGEIIVSAIQVVEGEDAAAVADSWSGATALVVRDAVRGLTKTGGTATGVVAL